MGRQQKEAKTKIEVFLTPGEIEKLEKLADRRDQSRSSTARALIIEGILERELEGDRS